MLFHFVICHFLLCCNRLYIFLIIIDYCHFFIIVVLIFVLSMLFVRFSSTGIGSCFFFVVDFSAVVSVIYYVISRVVLCV